MPAVHENLILTWILIFKIIQISFISVIDLAAVYGYDVSYINALKTANINSLSQRRSELCQSFFQQTISNPNNQ